MEANNRNIVVSVVVPVYNSAKYLRTCLDSLVSQNFENYEIVAVNNGSTDGSEEILNEYVEKYPDLFFAYTIEHSEFVGTGRNYGLSKARGEYIYLCDSDDIVERNALLFMYGRMKRYNLDVVYGTVEFVNLQSNTRFMLESDGEREVSIEELILSGAEFWRRMYKKSLLDKVGAIPEFSNFDDIAYLPIVHSYATKAMSTTRKIYNYFRRSTSTVGGTSKKVLQDTFMSEKYAVENCNPVYRDQVLMFVAKRIISNIKSRWLYKDILLEEIGYFWPQFENCACIMNDAQLYAELETYYKILLNMVPKKIYVAVAEGTDEDEVVKGISQKAFVEEESSVVLCKDLAAKNQTKMRDYANFIKAAKASGNTELLNAFYALFEIYENGGIYMDSRVKINNVLNYLCCNGSFFSFIDKNTYSGWIFGGGKGNEVIGKILDTFKGDGYYKDILYPIDARIKNILTVLYEVPLNGLYYSKGEVLTVYSPEVLVFDPYKTIGGATIIQICEHDFSSMLSEDYVVVKKSTLSWQEKSSKANRVMSRRAQSTLDGVSLADYQNMKHRLESIDNSDAMKLTLWLYKMGNKFTLPKKIVKKLLHKND